MCHPNGELIQKKKIYNKIKQLVTAQLSKYNEAEIEAIYMNIYYDHRSSTTSIDYPDIYPSEILEKIKKVVVPYLI